MEAQTQPNTEGTVDLPSTGGTVGKDNRSPGVSVDRDNRSLATET